MILKQKISTFRFVLIVGKVLLLLKYFFKNIMKPLIIESWFSSFIYFLTNPQKLKG
jgi:hypothetical protein